MPKKSIALTISFDGKPYQVEISEVYPGSLEVIVNGISHVVSIDSTSNTKPPQTSIPEAVKIQSAPSSPDVAQPTTAQTDLVSAPMPGDIIEVAVKPGDKISIGDKLLVLEAMKMKNIIRSPQAGKVTAVEVAAGQSVKFGEPLIRFG
jgi:biotin carboxyl carrier protein